MDGDSDCPSSKHPESIHARDAADQDHREENEPEIESEHGAPEDNHLHVPVFFDESSSRSSRRDEDNGSDQTVLNPRRVWESDRQAAECRRCGRRFNFLVRRHHCRRCGQVVCDRCSSHRIHLPPEDIIQDPMVDPSHYPLIALHPQRVCDACIRLPVKQIASSTASSSQRPAPMHMKRTGSTQSLMTECPVCGRPLLGMQKQDQENHLQQCLNKGSPPVRPPRYIGKSGRKSQRGRSRLNTYALVYELSEDSPQISYECPICFDEFKAGDKVARMICLCSYHHRCLTDWLERGKGCPVHYDATI
ncbi:hypothetical protein BCR43DRAFT_440430 [Syncephalastrum racemosum]|uniref:RING-type E3 ubiquitin transferase n=1 Tax=Syncephalastrum racemosum TaxID=13706 RepID=A0A1X2HDN9_SYNRA|nr:hypothetical protein BCR43DRAFT_440430 [Syncephalastrum racemosum]